MKWYVIVAACLLICLIGCNNPKANTNGNKGMNQGEFKSENDAKEYHVGYDDIHSLIPKGWGILIKDDDPVMEKGDLNKDGIEDVAMVIEELQSATESAPDRALLIAFGTDHDSFTRSIIAENVILPSDAGGVWGDPFESLSIDRGSVVVSDYGGSNWRWYNTYRFRYQDEDWYLIGATMGEYYTGNLEGNEEDYNLLTGDYLLKEMSEGEMKITERGNRGKKPLIKMSEFDLSMM